MNKFYLFFSIAIISIFGGIVFFNQTELAKKNIAPKNGTPTLPLESSTFTLISPSPNERIDPNQAAQQQQQQVQVAPTFGVEEPLKATYSATIKTSRGSIVMTLNTQIAPNTVKNFIDKARSNYYKNLIFHRVEDWVIQGGDPKGNGTGGGLMQTELNNEPFVRGSLGVARAGNPQISNDSQFFITKTDAASLTGQYTNFGFVREGMSVVDKIQIGDKILSIIIE